MQNQPITKKLLQEMTEKIVREINPRKVVLFGAHARGTARPYSDLDFLIINDDRLLYSVLALLASRGLSAAKHSGAISLFHREFVKPGTIPVKIAKFLDIAFDL